MGGVVKGLFGGGAAPAPVYKVDDSAARAAKAEEEKAKRNAQALADKEAARKKKTAATGRASTILAGENESGGASKLLG